jgi:transcription antitermination factor NusG
MRRTWYVLHVKPRTEKKVALYLSKYGFFYHLPLYVKVTKVQRRKVRRELPVFPGYVFTRLLPEERLKMLQTNLLVRTIEIPNPRQAIHQLRQVKNASRRTPEQLRTMSSVFAAGDYVRVTTGPLRGTEGYVKYDGGRASLCLNVEILGQSVEVAISPEDVEKVEKKEGK